MIRRRLWRSQIDDISVELFRMTWTSMYKFSFSASFPKCQTFQNSNTSNTLKTVNFWLNRLVQITFDSLLFQTLRDSKLFLVLYIVCIRNLNLFHHLQIYRMSHINLMSSWYFRFGEIILNKNFCTLHHYTYIQIVQAKNLNFRQSRGSL